MSTLPLPLPVFDALWLWWLLDPAQPRLIGTLRHVRRTARQPGGVSLEYAATWLTTGQAVSEDLPLQAGEFLPVEADSAAGAVDDARPDRWGERVIRLLDRPARLSTLEYLYFSGDDRFGALSVSSSAGLYLPRQRGPLPTLADVQAIHDLVRRVEAGETVDEPLRRLVSPGATLGGARPKALLTIGGAPWIVKFNDAGEPTDSPLVEHATMTLAAQAGIEVCETLPVKLALGHAVAVRRFDRDGARRKHALSAHVALRAAGQAYGYPEQGACRAWGRARVDPENGLSLGAKRRHTVGYGEHLQRRISPFLGSTRRAGEISGTRRRCRLVVWLGHTPRRRLARHRNSPRRGPDPKSDRLLALLLRRRGDADHFAQQGEQLFRRMVFNILIDNTDDHEKNHALIVNAAQRFALSPAFDVLPAGQALGYQQMRVGRDGACSTMDNAPSEHRAFALTHARARVVAAEVARVLDGWRAHFAQFGVLPQHLDLLAEQIDRPFLRDQRAGA